MTITEEMHQCLPLQFLHSLGGHTSEEHAVRGVGLGSILLVQDSTGFSTYCPQQTEDNVSRHTQVLFQHPPTKLSQSQIVLMEFKPM